MSERSAARWIVLKFGGTSVSNLPNWRNIAAVARKRLAEDAQVLIVHSAVSGITLDVSCDLSVNVLEKFASDGAGFDLVLAMHADRATARPLRVWPEQLVWVAGPGHSVWTRRPLPLVVYPDGCIYRRRLMRALEAAGMSSRIV